MKIKYVFANGDVSEVKVSDEIGAVIIDSRKAEHAQDERHRYHCYSYDAIDYEGKEYGVWDEYTIEDDSEEKGVLVNAVENPQMMLYALGALRIFDCLYNITEVSMTIYQPRRENVSTWTISVKELNDWAEQTLKPKAELAFKGEGEYSPGAWCQFCKAAVKCRARAEAKLKLAKYEFAKPPLLTDAEIGDILGKLDDLTKWANEIIAYAQEAAVSHGKQ